MTNINNEKSNWWRLPLEMQQLPQWALAGKDKAPYCVGANGPYHASPVDGTWHTFEDACKYAKQYGLGIGFILRESDPYTCIDMDVKDIRSRDKDGVLIPKEQWTPLAVLKFYEGTVDFAQSYTEFSKSGNGLHTWVLGNIGDGRRGKGFEVYSKERFMICTGDVVSQVQYNILNNVVFPQRVQCNTFGIADGTAILGSLLKELGGVQAVIALEEVEAVESDEVIMQRASDADNCHKFTELFQGRWKQFDYPSQSEADQGLLAMFAFYSESNEQCRRLYKNSVLGQRKKATIKYMNRALRDIRSRMEQDKLVEQEHQRQGKINADNLLNNKKIVETEFDSISVSIPKIPNGKAAKLTQLIYDASYIQHYEVSLISALALLSGLCARAFMTPTNAPLSQYYLLVAPTGSGKDVIHKIIPRILKASEIHYANKFVVAKKFVSGAALHRSESPRVYRRLLTVRGWSYENTKEISQRSQGARCTIGA